MLVVDDVDEARDGDRPTLPLMCETPRPQVIDRSPCVHLIRKLDDCMIEQNRNFSKCQSGTPRVVESARYTEISSSSCAVCAVMAELKQCRTKTQAE